MAIDKQNIPPCVLPDLNTRKAKGLKSLDGSLKVVKFDGYLTDTLEESIGTASQYLDLCPFDIEFQHIDLFDRTTREESFQVDRFHFDAVRRVIVFLAVKRGLFVILRNMETKSAFGSGHRAIEHGQVR